MTAWEEVTDWAATPQKPEPALDRTPIFDDRGFVTGFTGPESVIDDEPGWVNRIIVDGIGVSGHDHVAIDGSDFWYWKDDPGDYQSEQFRAYRWRLGGEPKVTVYVADQFEQVERDRWDSANVFPFAAFERPRPESIRHCIWALQDVAERLEREPLPCYAEWFPQKLVRSI